MFPFCIYSTFVLKVYQDTVLYLIVLFKVRSKIKSHNQNYTRQEGEEGLKGMTTKENFSI
jgi:hypothetical protein